MTRFDGRRALVTGAASGIGFETARLLREEGAAVAAADRADGLAAAAAELGATPVAVDVTDEASVVRAVAEAGEALGGPVDVLVNCAGIYRIRPLLELEAAEWDEVVSVNLRGSFLVGREVARALAAAGRSGAIVNLSSIAAVRADVDEPGAHYNASKAAVSALTRQMAAEWARHGIRVNAVAPGVIATPMLRLLDDPARAERYLREGVPLGRLGEAGEVAAAIVFLASDAASYVTGAVLPVDGGAGAV
ncbi:MAG: SDR family oxidoreductase [Rhodospirillales bacterium]|nr:SDR family oxidoreductase [Rhodospirillales bacterium]